jgi:alpha-D-ribose 1-methylphosphonate 5-triphosphate synthase subunit PhnL
MFTQYSTVLKQVRVSDIRTGSVVIVKGNFGLGMSQIVSVDYVEDNIKNGKPGITYGRSWAYLDQVVQVLKY